MPEVFRPRPLSRLRCGVFSGAVCINRPHGAPKIFHAGGSAVGVGVVILVLRFGLWILDSGIWSKSHTERFDGTHLVDGSLAESDLSPDILVDIYIYIYIYIYAYYYY